MSPMAPLSPAERQVASLFPASRFTREKGTVREGPRCPRHTSKCRRPWFCQPRRPRSSRLGWERSPRVPPGRGWRRSPGKVVGSSLGPLCRRHLPTSQTGPRAAAVLTPLKAEIPQPPGTFPPGRRRNVRRRRGAQTDAPTAPTRRTEPWRGGFGDETRQAAGEKRHEFTARAEFAGAQS